MKGADIFLGGDGGNSGQEDGNEGSIKGMIFLLQFGTDMHS